MRRNAEKFVKMLSHVGETLDLTLDLPLNYCYTCFATYFTESELPMAQELFQPFLSVPYPCYWISDSGDFLMNEAAGHACTPLSDKEAMARILRSALQEHRQKAVCAAYTLPLLTDALSMRTLTLLPNEEGLVAVAVDEQTAPVEAFSTEMREPLTNIFAPLPLLTSRLDDMDVRYTDEIQANCYQLLRLASNLENGSRVEKKLFHLTPVDACAHVDALCYSASSVCRERGVPIEWSVPAGPLPVRADSHLMGEAILNLIRNSLQFTQDGNHIFVKLEAVGGYASLTVEDHGLGIRPENLEHVFDPYYSVCPYGDSNVKPGLGLGLSVVRQTICGFGGTVTIESRFGEGTRVHSAIPLAKSCDNVMGSDPADYLLNRYSPIYVQLCGYCRLPHL